MAAKKHFSKDSSSLQLEVVEDMQALSQSLQGLPDRGLVWVGFVGEPGGPKVDLIHIYQCDHIPGMVKRGPFRWY